MDVRAVRIAALLIIALLPVNLTCSGQIHGKGNSKRHYLAPAKPLLDKTYSAKTVFLTGGVQHSETLPPLKSKLNVGAVYDENEVEKPPPSRDWFKVPLWLSGTWECSTQTTTAIDDYKSGKFGQEITLPNHGIAHYGKQRDRSGAVWDLLDVPVEVQSETDKVIDKDLTTQQSIMKNSDNLLAIKDVFTRREIDRKTKKILQVTQMEQISTLEPVGKDTIRLFGSLKEFDRNGNRLRLTNAVVIYKRTAPFTQCDFEKRTHEDLRPSFYKYLKTHGMANLIPARQ
jgi:hypothetical protein